MHYIYITQGVQVIYESQKQCDIRLFRKSQL